MNMIGYATNGMGETFERRGFAPDVSVQIFFPGGINQFQSVFRSPYNVIIEFPNTASGFPILV